MYYDYGVFTSCWSQPRRLVILVPPQPLSSQDVLQYWIPVALACSLMDETVELSSVRHALINIKQARSLLRPCLVPKIFQNSPSHRILWHMHEALNIDENKN